MRESKSTEGSTNLPKQKPKSIGRLFGFLKQKIKDGIHDLTSMTTKSEKAGREEVVLDSPKNIPHCPIPRVPRKASHFIHNEKPVKISQEHDQLLAIQVQKCYRNIPEAYFIQNYDIQKGLFSKSLKDNNQKRFQLNDYLDEVQFNIQELVKSKQEQLLVALENMSSMNSGIDGLVLSLKMMRKNNQDLKGKLAGKAERIKKLQEKSDRLQKMRAAANNLKLVLSYPNIIKTIFSKDKLLAIKYFKEYLQVHQKFKSLCGCTNKQRKQCQYQSVKESLKSGFQQTFSKSYWNYITQGLFYEQSELKSLFGTKKDFQSMPGMASAFSLADFIASGPLDESICQEEKYELAIKENVEEEIKALILAGLPVCDFENGSLLTNLQEFMEDFQKGFLSDILTEIKESFMMDTDNHLVAQSKGIKLLLEELAPLVQKIKTSKFLKVVDFYSEIIKKAIRRTYSILHRVLRSFSAKKITKVSHIEQSLVEVCFQVTSFADKYLSKFIELSQIPKEENLSTFRDLVQVFESWEDFAQEINEYFVASLNSESDIIKKGICRFHNLQALKIRLAGLHLKGLHQNVLTKELKNSMEQDKWIQVDVDPKFYNIVGFVLEGEKFNEDRKRLALLSSSLFLQKKPQNQCRSINFDYFSISHNEIIIHNKRYKPTSSLLVLIEIIEEYLKMNEIDEQMNSEVSSKLLELINFYNSFLFQLILNASAIHHNRIGNSITIRHLCLSYHAVSLLLTIVNALKQRIESVGFEKIGKLMEKMISHEQEIIKKIQSIIPHRISQEAKLMSLQKPGPSKGTENIATYLRNINDTLKQYFEEQQVKRMLNSSMLSAFIQKLLKFRPKTKGEQESLQLQISYFLIETEFLASSMSGYQEIKRQLNNISKFQ